MPKRACSYDDPLLVSAYAAAGVFCLPSRSEVMPLSVMEALASGRRVVMTRNHCMDLSGLDDLVAEIEPDDVAGIRHAVLGQLAWPASPARCRDAVRHYTWDAVADQIIECYRATLGGSPGL